MKFSHLLLPSILAVTTNMALLLSLRAVSAFSTQRTTTAAFSTYHAKRTLPQFLGRSTFRLVRERTTPPTTTTTSMSSSSSEDASITEEETNWEQYRNKNNVNDQVFSAISADGGIKVTAATVRNLVNEFMIMHTMTEVPADALGRAAACSVLLSNGMQDEQVFQVSMNGDGPLRGVVAISNGKGEVRGYVGNPGIGDMPLKEAVGKGTVNVVKNHPDWPNPYNGITAIRDGDIDRDIGIYLAESEQRSCALAAATTTNGILCTAAGGYLVEQLPECSEETIKKVEANLATLVKKDGSDRLPTGLLHTGVTPLEIAEIILDGLDMQPLQQIEPKATCKCSEERLFRSIRLLPREEVDEIMEKEEQIEARCHFCGKVYRMGPEEVAKRFAEAKGDPSLDSDFNSQ